MKTPDFPHHHAVFETQLPEIHIEPKTMVSILDLIRAPLAVHCVVPLPANHRLPHTASSVVSDF